MSASTVTRGQRTPRGGTPLLLAAIVVGTSLMFAAIAVREPLLSVAAAFALLIVIAIAVLPDAPTLVFLFVLYSNAAVVAVHFHDLPFIIGAATPALLTIPLAYYVVAKRQKIVVNSTLYLMVLYFLVQLLAALFAEEIKPEVLLTFAVEGIGLYFLLINAVRTPRALRLAVWVLVLAGMFLGGLSFFQEITATQNNNYGGFAQIGVAFGTGEETLLGEVTQPRAEGPIGDANRYAQTLLMLAPLALFRLWSERSLWLRLLAAVATGLILIGVALTYSRAGFVAIVILIIAMVFMRYIKLYQFAVILAVMALVALLVPNLGGRLVKLEDFVNLAVVEGSGADAIEAADSSTKSRVTEMLAAVLMFVDHPILGVGPGMYPENYQEYAEIVGLRVKNTYRKSHFLYGDLAAETGIFGLILFFLIVYVNLRDLARVRKRWAGIRPDYANMATGFILAMFTYLITGIFMHIAYIRFFWLIMALAGAAVQISRNEAGRLPLDAESEAKRIDTEQVDRHSVS